MLPRPLANLGLLIGLLICALAIEPALANKFETISGGVSGSSRVKQEWVEGFLMVAGGVAMLLAVLALVIPHTNPLFVNYTTWKQSAVVLFVIGVGCLGGSMMI